MIERNRETRRKIKANKWESKLRKLWDSWWLSDRVSEVKKDKKIYYFQYKFLKQIYVLCLFLNKNRIKSTFAKR